MIFTLHQDVERTGEAEAIPEAAAPLALLFPPVWLAWHGLWWELGFYLLAVFILLSLLATPLAPVAVLLSFLPGMVVFLEGNQWRRARAERYGRPVVDVIEADDAEEALLRFMAHGEKPFLEGLAP